MTWHEKGGFLSVLVVVNYDASGKVASTRVIHHLDNCSIEDKLSGKIDQLWPAK
jgi:hypothetical protein